MTKEFVVNISSTAPVPELQRWIDAAIAHDRCRPVQYFDDMVWRVTGFAFIDERDAIEFKLRFGA